MIGKIFCILTSSSFAFALVSGKMNELSAAVLSGAADAAALCISTLGVMCLWSGVIGVFDGVGVTALIAKVVRPILKYIYPTAHKTGVGIDEIAANFAANLLGLGNAALPFGLSAMEKLSELEKKYPDSHDMLTFAVMNTVPFQAFPTTLIALREAAGSQNPYDIILPIYLCSFATIIFAALVCRLCAAAKKTKRHG
ncbi:MAG: hypothetical protein IKV97_03305 [Clostridia bacterium]|nr:hypothetical protein [Clostridia bacterium]